MYIQVMTYTNDRAAISDQVKASSKVDGRHYAVGGEGKASWILPKTPNFSKNTVHFLKIFRIPEEEWDAAFFDDINSVDVLASMLVDENYSDEAFFNSMDAPARAKYQLAWETLDPFCVFL